MKRRCERPPLILGHRGYKARYPENTLLAFGKAMEAGADGIECDVQKTADGRYVVIHDPTTDRVTGTPGSVAGMTLGQIRLLDAGRSERIPTLEEMLDWLPQGTYLDLELKEETLGVKDCEPIAAILDARVPRRRLMISSFESELLAPLRARGFTVGLLLGEGALERGFTWLARTLARLRPRYLNLPIQLIPLMGRHKAGLFLRFMRCLGFAILFWTVNDEEGERAVAGLARIFVTDEVELMVKLQGVATPARRRAALRALPPRRGAPRK